MMMSLMIEDVDEKSEDSDLMQIYNDAIQKFSPKSLIEITANSESDESDYGSSYDESDDEEDNDQREYTLL